MARTSTWRRLTLPALGLMLLALLAASGGEASTFYRAGTTGYDVSFPQCGKPLPRGGSFGVVGVTSGLPWSANPCLGTQYQWALSMSSPASFYVNTANPGPPSKYWGRPGPQTCADPTSYSDTGCSYNYGWNAAADAFSIASSATAGASRTKYWWLDVETMNSWEGSDEANAATVEGYVDYLTGQGASGVGIYSTAYQWALITGDHDLPSVPNWVAGASNQRAASKLCNASFTDGPVWLVQYSSKSAGADYVCR